MGKRNNRRGHWMNTYLLWIWILYNPLKETESCKRYCFCHPYIFLWAYLTLILLLFGGSFLSPTAVHVLDCLPHYINEVCFPIQNTAYNIWKLKYNHPFYTFKAYMIWETWNIMIFCLTSNLGEEILIVIFFTIKWCFWEVTMCKLF